MQQIQDFDSIPLDHVERERIARLQRAGVRHRPVDVAPTSAFVAVETAVLVMVAALAMTSIIVTAGGVDAGTEQAARRAPDTTHRIASTGVGDAVRHDALFVAR